MGLLSGPPRLHPEDPFGIISTFVYRLEACSLYGQWELAVLDL